MPLNESASFLVSTVLSVLTFSLMQILRPQLASTQLMTILGGFLGSILFVFLVTCLGNLGKTVLGKNYASQWFEVAFCMGVAAFAGASVHRVSG